MVRFFFDIPVGKYKITKKSCVLQKPVLEDTCSRYWQKLQYTIYKMYQHVFLVFLRHGIQNKWENSHSDTKKWLQIPANEWEAHKAGFRKNIKCTRGKPSAGMINYVTYRVYPPSGLQWLSGRQQNPLQNPKQNPHGALRQCLSPVLVPVLIPQPKVPNTSPANSTHLESNKFEDFFENSVARHGLTKEHSVQLHCHAVTPWKKMCLEIMRILLNACKTFIRDSGPFIKKYYKKADMVWRCLTMFDSVRMCPTMIDMSCSAKHFDPLQAAPLMKQNFLLPRCQWHLHQQHWRRHLPRNSAFGAKVKVRHMTQSLLDWCSDVFWRVMELLVIAYLCMIMYASCSFFGIESAHHLAFSDSLVGRRIHYRTQSRIHTGLCDSACLLCWCRC